MSAAVPAPRSRTKPSQKPSRKVPAHWLPRQHGAWAMLFVPFIVGVSLRVQEGRGEWLALPLLLLWVLGYFAFHALSLWLKSGHQARYLAPLKVYGGLCLLLGGLVLWQKPALLDWAALYAPLLGVGLWRAAHKDDTSVAARWSAVLAACLMCAVSYSEGLRWLLQMPLDAGAVRVLRATLLLSAYFLGTVLYVKTMIREKGEKAYLAASLGFHGLLLLLALVYGAGGGLALFLAALLVRAALMPWLAQRGKQKITPKQVGILEFGLSVALLLMLVG